MDFEAGDIVKVNDNGQTAHSEFYDLGATSHVLRVGENSMRGYVLVTTIDPSTPGLDGFLCSSWVLPEHLTKEK